MREVMPTLLNDVRYGIRTALRSPGFAASAVLTLALGIGAATAVFTVVNALVLRPLPFRDPEQLVRITVDLPGRRASDVGIAIAELFDIAQRTDVFAQVSGVFAINANLSGTDEPERIEAQLVSVNYFDLLGARPQIGRLFTPGDYHPGIAEVAVISDSLWTRRFGRHPDVIGRKIRMDNDLYVIVGVTQPDFEHPGRGIEGRTEMWSPAGYRASPFRAPVRGSYPLTGALARLAPGVSLAQAQSQLDSYAREIAVSLPADYPPTLGWRARAIPLHDDLLGDTTPALAVLMGAVALVLLIACANVANLLLARAAGRQREFAIRRALGAGSGRILVQLVAESSVLAFAAGLLALILTMWTIDVVAALVPSSVVPLTPIAVDTSVVVFGAALAMFSVFLFGLAPALHAATASLNPQLRDSANTTASPKRQRMRSSLAVAQCALALVLLIGATLLVRTFQELNNVDLGFRHDNVLAVRIWMPQPNIPSTGPYFRHDQRLPFLRAVETRLRALGSVENVGWSTHVPLTSARPQPFLVEGRPLDERSVATTEVTLASASSFEVLGVPLRRGRMFTEADTADAAAVVVVNEAFARRYFPREDPVGRRIRSGGPNSTAPWRTIVGVVGDMRSQRPDAAPEPQIFAATTQASSLAMALLIRTRGGDAATLADAIRREVRRVDPEMPVYGIEKLEAVVARSTGQRRFAATLLFCFAGFALVLAAVGLYAVIAYLVSQRTHEIGLRMALGARTSDVLRMVIAYGAGLAAAGIVIGLAAAVPLSRLLQSLLFGVSSTDPATFVALPLALCAVALLACYLPARRAIRINPIEALRQD